MEEIIRGKFYTIEPGGKITIGHGALVDFMNENGFVNGFYYERYHLLRIENNIISATSIPEVVRFIDDYIKNILPFDIGNGATSNDLRNAVIRGSKTYFEKIKLDFLPVKRIITHRDTRHEAFFHYKNCYVKVTAEEITVHPYSELKELVWKNQIKQRELEIVEMKERESEIEQFLFNVSDRDETRYKSLVSLIGFVQHNFKDLSQAKVLVLVDEEIGELGDANGGTGKSIIAKAIINMKNGVLIPGKNFNIEKSFAFERVELGTDIIVIDDARLNEKFESFYNIITEGITVEKKHKGEFFIHFETSPKLVITTNHVLRSPEGNSAERRKIEFEVSPFYNNGHQPQDDFGHMLFAEWDASEWLRFDNAMMRFTQAYLKNGIIDPPKINITLRKLLNDIGAELVEFMDDKIMEGKPRINKKDTHDEFIKAYPTMRKYYPSTNKFTKKMKRYFTDKGIGFNELPANTKKYFLIHSGNNASPVDENPETPKSNNSKTPADPNDKEPDGDKMFTVKDVVHDYHVVDTAEKRSALIKLLSEQNSFAFDTETTGLDPLTMDIVGLSISIKPHEAFYIPLPEAQADAEKILSEFKDVFGNENSEKIAHNIKYDMRVLCKYGTQVRGRLFDTMIAHYLCFPNSKHHGLKPLCEEFFNYRQVYFEDLIGKGINKKSIREVPLPQLAEYACEDADYTLQLKLKFEKLLNDNGATGLFRDIEMPLVSVIADMEHEGANVDTSCLLELKNQTDAVLQENSKSIYEHAGEEFNISSPVQISSVLFEKLDIPTGSIRKGKSGSYSTNKDELRKIEDAHPIIPLIVKQKELLSIRANFFEKLPLMVNPLTRRVHTKYNQAIASTGRLSSSEPNLQNVPKKATGLGSQVRKAFVPRNEDHVIISADYSQIELRIVAHLSGDESLIEAFRQNLDVHSATAAKIYDVSVEEITKDDPRRKIAKSVNFGLNYGMTRFGLAKRLTAETGKQVSESEAQETIDTYFENFVGVKKFMEQAVFDATVKGYAETLFNRRRELKEIDSRDSYRREAAKRIAVNMPIQGTAADLIKLAMIKVHQKLTESKMSAKMIMQIHDELVFDCPKSELEQTLLIIRNAMENVVELNVPLTVDIGYGETWLDAH